MNPASSAQLYTFVDTAYLHGRSPADVARQLCEGGSDLIQLRAKNSSLEETRQMAEAIAPICQKAGVSLVINDHLELAKNVKAAFVHLGQEDFFDAGFTHVSQIKAPDAQLQVGLSTHAPEQATRAIAAGADYLAIGPVYATGTKPTARPVTLDYVRWASQNVPRPWFAIGGITLENLEAVMAAGASRICVVSAILNARDIRQKCREFRQRLDQIQNLTSRD